MNKESTVLSAMNLRNLLEKTDLVQNGAANRLNGGPQNSKEDAEKKEVFEDAWGLVEAQAAFLGPSLWDNGDLKMEYMDLDEFLCENGIPSYDKEEQQNNAAPIVPVAPVSATVPATSQAAANGMNTGCDVQKISSPSYSIGSIPTSPSLPLSPGESLLQEEVESIASAYSSCSSGNSIASSPLTSLLTPPAQGKRKRAAATAALSSFSGLVSGSEPTEEVPGQDFDPTSRHFTEDELRPQPMSKKSKKQYVPDDLKDDKYWARRRKNNMAAKRSRDARRVKENQIAMRASFLEKENMVLRGELEKVTKLYAAALQRLEQYEKSDKRC